LLGTDATVEPLKPVLIARTGGNPLFLEESVRTLVETHALTGERGAYRLVRPLATIDVPATVQAILASRIDRLAPEDKQLLQTASVIGKDVPFALLQAIAELPEDALRRGLAHLQSAEFLYETSLFPDLEYTFKHALTHEVAYGSLLQERRRALHRAVVTGSERLHADRLAEHYERLAYHAGLGELWEKAVRYGREAGLKAIAHSANQDAARFLQQALDALARLPETPETLAQSIDARLELRTALQALRDLDGQRLHLAEAIRQAEAIGDQRRLGRALMFEALRTALSGDYTGAGSVGRRALEIGDSLGDVTISVLTRCYLGISCDAAGDFRAASELLERALTLLPGNLMAECLGQAGITSALALGTLGRVYAEQGRFADALAKANEALRIAETASHGYSIATHTWSRGLVKLRLGDFVGAVVDLERSRSVWQSLHIAVWPDTVATLGVAYCRVGRFAEGLELVEEAESQRGILMSNPPIAALAEAYFLARRLEEAGVQAQRALVYARERTQRGVEARVLALVAALAAAGGPAANDTAERLYMQATALAERLGMRPLVAHCHLGLSKLYRSTDKREPAQAHLTTATTMYREMDMRFWLEQAEAELGELA
jgi:tetratricopeptide (TPR) repeat protein